VPDFPRACTSYEEHLSALIDGELTGELEQAVRSHVDSCPHCSAHCDALRRVDGLLVEAPAPAVPAGLRQRLAARIQADRETPELRTYVRSRPTAAAPARSGERRPGRRRTIRPAAVFTAAAAAGALVLYWTVRSGEPPRPDAPVAPPVARTAPEPARPTTPEPIPAPTPTPARPTPREETLVAETPPEVDLEAIDEEELALALEMETLEDLEVIANLDLLTRLVELEEEAG
jgi:anti-sigma factor (TIGR02949 family)